jgi:peptidase A4-like protein
VTRRFRHPRFGLLLPILTVVVLGIALPGNGKDHGTSSDASFGKFAGYIWRGRIASVGGSWTVPRIINSSPPGAGSTWVGAQAPGSPNPFIQIGTNEERGLPHPRPSNYGYYAFWSDTVRHFHAQFLFRVNPGDSLSASLTLAHKRWALRIVDETSGVKEHFLTGDEAGGSFNVAEWTQEDPTKATGGAVLYPQLTTVGFRDLKVNSTAPTYASLHSTWMSVNGENLAPSPLRNDSFVLQQASVSAVGERYLQIAGTANAAADTFLVQRADWTARTRYATIEAASSAFVAAVRKSIGALASTPWPKEVQSLISLLIHDSRVLAARARAPAIISAAALLAWRAAVTRAVEANGRVGHEIRRALHVPEMTPP